MGSHEAEQPFLRSLPMGIAAPQVIALDGLGVSIDAIELCYKRMRAAALTMSPPSARIEHSARLGLFIDARSMIDHTHMIRILLRKISNDIPHPQFSAFISAHESATRLRNAMDHLDDNIGNLSSLKDKRPPIHGILSFFRPALTPAGLEKLSVGKHPTFQDIDSSHIVALTMGALIHAEHAGSIVNVAGKKVTYPVGNFTLHAFREKIDLSAVWEDAAALGDLFNTELRQDFERQLREHARTNNVNVKRLLEPRATGITSVATVSVRKPES